MFLRDLTGPCPRDVVVRIDDPEATVADLAEALDPQGPPCSLLVDGRLVAAATPLDRARIGDGAEVGLADRVPPDPTGTPSPAVVAVTVTVGPDAGRRVLLPAGDHPVGRIERVGPHLDGHADPGGTSRGVGLADPTVSTRQAILSVARDGSVTVVDDGAHNPTRVGEAWATRPTPVHPTDHVGCGATRFRVEPVAERVPSAPPQPPGPLPRPLHRRGRPVPAPDLPLLVPPPEPEPAPMVTPVGVIGVLASVAVGAVMVVVLGSWLYAIFALLGPVLMVANALDSRRRRRRSGRLGDRRRQADLAAFSDEVQGRQRTERSDRWRQVTGPGEAQAVIDGHHLTAGLGGGRLGCWERRRGDADAFTVRVGIGNVPWDPPVAGSSDRWPDDVTEAISRHRLLVDVPVSLRLRPGAAVAVVGGGDAALAVARSIVVQVAVAHGPADLQVAVLAGDAESDRWDWTCWLPHTIAPDLGCLVAVGADRTAALADALAIQRDDEHRFPLRLVIVDDRRGLEARRSGVRTVLRAGRDDASGLIPVVLVDQRSQVPASCSTVLEIADDGTLHGPPDLCCGAGVVAGTADEVAASMARSLARFEDPEVDDPGRGLPDRVPLVSLLGTDRLSPAGIGARWMAAGPDPAPVAVLGSTTDGPLVVDLATDGPHALVAGTTGSGKSELLRTLVLSLAATASPRHLTFVLIDFKGGSAFDACARLPHTCGVVTDLDEHLASRALRCLEAELRHRELRLRQVGADDLGHLRRIDPGGEPLPRLVVVVDEFATLAAELPDFVDSLVGVAQRGRSLGVHLVLATQRPSGAVSESIRANLSLRLALRVQSTADSTDVIGDPSAAEIPRRRPGRALARLGPGELVAVQTALATADALGGGGRASGIAGRVTVRPLTVRSLGGPVAAEPGRAGTPTRTDLEVVVEAMASSWAATGGAAPRQPWPDPLPEQVDWPVPVMAPERASEVVIGLADDPDQQRQIPHVWDLIEGPLLLVGLPGSGTSTALATVALEVARRFDADGFHIHALDLGAGDLAALTGLPHVGAVVHGADRERQRRLVADLFDDLTHRSADPSAPAARRLVLLDGLGAFRALWDEVEPSGTWDRFLAVVARGGAVGIHVAMAADGPSAAPHQVVGACRQRLVFKLGDAADHTTFAIPAAAVPTLMPGRALSPNGPTLVQVARPPYGLASAVARIAGAATPASGGRAPVPVGLLPRRVAPQDLGAHAVRGEDGSLTLPIGLSDVGLTTASLTLPAAGHALVAGPPRSGRTTALQTMSVVARAVTGLTVVAVTRSPGGWDGLGSTIVDPARSDLGLVLDRQEPILVLVDDADLTPDDHRVLAAVVVDRRPHRHVVAAARSDRARSSFGHWLREVRADRAGLLLLPDLDVDGDLIGARLPRRSPVLLTAGRGWLSGGSPEGFLQVADPCP